jgi:hypothetical protein
MEKEFYLIEVRSKMTWLGIQDMELLNSNALAHLATAGCCQRSADSPSVTGKSTSVFRTCFGPLRAAGFDLATSVDQTNVASFAPNMAARARWVAAYLLQVDTFAVKLVPFVDQTEARSNW